MERLAILSIGLIGALISTQIALAHPLGNFTSNHYARIELEGDAVRVRYVLDLAEIPSVQETRVADTDGDGTVSPAEWDVYKQRKIADILQQLQLIIDDKPVGLRASETLVSQPIGQGDIPLVRLEAWLTTDDAIAPNVQHRAVFRDRTDATRIGWREIVVHAGSGGTLSDSNVPSSDVTDELRSYPDDMLQNPLDRREADWTFSMDGRASTANEAQATTAPNRPTDPFAALVTAADLNPAVVLLAVVGAAVLGGIHAASPGHGKSIMAAYIVGKGGTIVQAIVLALSVTASHTTGVLILGILTVIASNLIVPEHLYPWLTLTSGAIVLAVGLRFLWTTALHERQHRHHHGHDHTHNHEHEDVAPTWRGLFALGLAGGIVPSGSALVVLLSSIALGRLGFGLVLIVAFGVGMAVVLVTTGVLLVHAGRLMVRLVPANRAARFGGAVPVLSAAVMTLLGVAATYEGIAQLR